jgi:hypothetical protein
LNARRKANAVEQSLSIILKNLLMSLKLMVLSLLA